MFDGVVLILKGVLKLESKLLSSVSQLLCVD